MRRTKNQLRVATALLKDPEGRHYGYPLQKSAGVRSGALYPMLGKWLAAGWLTDGWESVDRPQLKRPLRRYYQLTPEGQAALSLLLRGLE